MPSNAKCPHCSGRMETITPPKMAAFQRCMTCGRDDRVVAAPASAAAPAGSTAPLNGRKCVIGGCPGRIDGTGVCQQCAKRAAWAEQHTPKRKCEICDGVIDGSRNRKYCEACAPIVQRANVAKHDAEKAKR